MITILSTVTSWGSTIRIILGVFAGFLLAPIAAVPLGLLAFLMIPAAICGLPFLLVSFLGSANTEHQEAVKRASWRPMPHGAHAHA
jgi:hypothetical protein